jgi:hypothetical protein
VSRRVADWVVPKVGPRIFSRRKLFGNMHFEGYAQLALGAGGRWFESSRPDHFRSVACKLLANRAATARAQFIEPSDVRRRSCRRGLDRLPGVTSRPRVALPPPPRGALQTGASRRVALGVAGDRTAATRERVRHAERVGRVSWVGSVGRRCHRSLSEFPEEESPPPGRVPGVSPESHPPGSGWARRRRAVYRGRDAALR